MRLRNVLLLVAAIAPIASYPPQLRADELTPANFARLHQLIRPQADESQWLGIPWLTSIWEARQQAAAQGKPILLWSGGGAAPIGAC